jgi:S-DNA-T family DNA segregation ATPase FtsK/SpoIIIE
VALFIGVWFYVANKNNTIAVLKVIAGILAVFILTGLLHGVFGNKELETIGESYQYCALHHNGGGLLGAAVFVMLSSAFGKIGAFVLLLALGSVCGVIISEKSFVKGVKKGSKKVYDTAKEESVKRKERVEERREKRLEKKASGVNMDVKLTPEAVHRENMTELTEISETAREELFLSPQMAEIPVHMPVKEEISEIPVRIAEEPVMSTEAEPVSVMEVEKPVSRRRKKAEPAE